MPDMTSGETDEPISFVEFYDREYHLVVRFIMNCGASLAAAEDAAQEAFLEAWHLMSVAQKWVSVLNRGRYRTWLRCAISGDGAGGLRVNG